MIYLVFSALHILAVVLWVGSLFLLTLITAKSTMSAEQLRSATKVTDAAIGVTWLAGIVLVLMGGWYTSTWWQIKVVLVIVISAIHSIVHRRWRQAGAKNVPINSAIPLAIAALTFFVILLVVLKRPV